MDDRTREIINRYLAGRDDAVQFAWNMLHEFEGTAEQAQFWIRTIQLEKQQRTLNLIRERIR